MDSEQHFQNDFTAGEASHRSDDCHNVARIDVELSRMNGSFHDPLNFI
jgi:hypothetical protein